MLIRKYWQITRYQPSKPCFNPSYSGCWFGSWLRRRLLRNRQPVSILLILDVDSEVPSASHCNQSSWSFNPSYSGCWFGSLMETGRNGFFNHSFNPSYSGCWFGSFNPAQKASCKNIVSILLILDVDSEEARCAKNIRQTSMFQSFLFWMLIRKKWTPSNPVFLNLFQSFLFWMLIRKRMQAKLDSIQAACFNPSYSGCWFGSGTFSLYTPGDSVGFNPSYSGCWFGS